MLENEPNNALLENTDNNNNKEDEVMNIPDIDIPEGEGEEDENLDKEIQIDPNAELKKKLMFEQKNISIMQLYCHLSGKSEVCIMIFGLLVSIFSGIASPLMILLFGEIIDDFGDLKFSYNAIPQHDITYIPVKSLITNEFKDIINKMILRFLYIGIAMLFAGFFNNTLWSYVGQRQIQHLKEKYFKLILTQEQGWFDSNNAFEFSTKVQAQLEQIELGMGDKFGLLLQMVSQLFSGLTVAFISSWKLTLVMLSFAPLLAIMLGCLFASLKSTITLSIKTYEIAGGIAEELLYNIKTVASFANFEYEKQRFNFYIDKCLNVDIKRAFKFGMGFGVLMMFLNFTFVIALLYGRTLVANGLNDPNGLKAGKVLTVIFSTIMAIMSLGAVSPNLKIIQETTVAASDYFTLLERIPQINLLNSIYRPSRDDVQGRIEFKNISFTYPSDINQRQILDGLNLVFEPGKKIALVGESGCGKSTIVNIIERLYEPNRGEVLIDGIDIKEYEINYLRTLIGYVQQEPVLFNKSIKENVIFGRDELLQQLGNAEQLIDEACDDAYAKEFIDLLPGKYEYVVGIKGSKLSGGQKQRIAIARAILCKPKILILDEATSSLDNKSEKEVQYALDHICQKNVTTIIIAHRLSTIKNADLIYAIKDGKVIEQGTHKELLEMNGYYAKLVSSQVTIDELESKEDNLPTMFNKKTSIRKLSHMLSEQNSEILAEVIDPETQIKNISKPQTQVRRSELFYLLKDHTCTLIFAGISALITGAAIPFQGFIMANSINGLQQTDADKIRSSGFFWSMMFLIFAVVNGLFLFIKIWKFIEIGVIITSSIRKQILDKYLKLHISYYDINENTPGALLTKLSIDTTQLNSLVLSVVGDLVSVIGIAVCGFTMGMYYSWRLCLIAFCFIPITVCSSIFINKTMKRDEYKKINIEAGSILSECVVNTKTIYSFNFQKPAVDMYLNIIKQNQSHFTRDSIIKGISMGLGMFAVYACNATVFHFAWNYIEKGLLNVENMNITMNCVMTLTSGISQNINGLTDYSKAAKSFNSVYSTLDTECLIDTSEEGNKDKTTAQGFTGKIEFKNVSFAYPTKPDQMILKNISFVIEAGQKAALVGYSGCGKSTIIQLIERFYDISEGEILLDGVNIKDYNLLDLRKKIGLVSQEPVLFKRSVYENIRYGRLDATKEEVFNAAKKACIEKFFNKKEMGTKEDPVSGGEKQRLAIARAFLKNPVLLLLDEATSSLDKENEIAVQKSIDELQQGRTCITVAHRLSTIENSDVIFVLEAGQIVEKGTHSELMELGGKYAMLHKYTEG